MSSGATFSPVLFVPMGFVFEFVFEEQVMSCDDEDGLVETVFNVVRHCPKCDRSRVLSIGSMALESREERISPTFLAHSAKPHLNCSMLFSSGSSYSAEVGKRDKKEEMTIN